MHINFKDNATRISATRFFCFIVIMKLKVLNTIRLKESVWAPSSKSHSVRALLIASLAKGRSVLKNVLMADDTAAAIEVCRNLGAKVTVGEKNAVVKGAGTPLSQVSKSINTGNSGVTTHFIMPMLGLRRSAQEVVNLDCGGQMKARPIEPLIKALNLLGMTVTAKNQDDRCPLSLSGNLRGGDVEIDGANSQYLSALLLSLPLASHDSVVRVKNLRERPYVEMTARWLDEQEIDYEWKKTVNEDLFKIKGGQQYRPFNKVIPGDFSSASYLMAAAALLLGEVKILGLDFDDPQGDKELVNILKKMGADIRIENEEVVIRGGKKLHGLSIDCQDIPDLLPTLAVLGSQAEGETKLFNVPHARIKETDRISSMVAGLRAMGARVQEKSDGLVVQESRLLGAVVFGCDDHRTIMSLAIAGLVAQGVTTIDTAEGIKKTFPKFIETMKSLGANLSSS